VLLAVVAFVQVVGTIGASQGQPEAVDLDGFAVVLLLAGPAALAVLWDRPRYALWTAIACSLLYLGLGYPYGPFVLTPVIGLMHAVVSGHRRDAWIAGVVGIAGALALHAVSPRDDAVSWGQVAGVTTWVAIVLVAGEIVRARVDRRNEARLAAAEQARRRAGEERLRIAQELHDVLAHNISLINVQAGVGLHLMDTNPEQARDALGTIKHASKDALEELRAALDLLRSGDAAPRAPTGGLAQLDSLVARVRSPELDVRVERRGDSVTLPAGLDLAAFRIVQEALTNVVRHASSARTVRVWLDYRDDSLAVHVDDDGRTPSPTTGDDAGSGNGLPGMRERATALGGSFRAGPRPGGGFAVHAVLPTGPSDAPRSGPPHAEPSSTVADAAATGSQP
jgi:signal transduction histidine kinase